MNEKTKGFLIKENQSDEELERFLFAMNQQSIGIRESVRKAMEHLIDHKKMVDTWLIKRLESTKPIPEGLENEMQTAMAVLTNLRLNLGMYESLLEVESERAEKRYRKADKGGSFFQEKTRK